MKFPRPLLLFAVVGCIGFAVDASVLSLVKGALGLYAGRLISFSASVLVTWMLNRAFTFSDRASGKSKLQEFATYALLMLAGGSVNYGIYAMCVAFFARVYEQPVLGVAAGSLAGMMFNFFGAKKFLFKRSRTPSVHS